MDAKLWFSLGSVLCVGSESKVFPFTSSGVRKHVTKHVTKQFLCSSRQMA